MLFAGKLGRPSTGDMCGLDLKHSCILPRVEAWRNAFVAANRDALNAMWGEARRRLTGKFSRTKLKRNGRHFLRYPMEAHFLSCGEVHVTNPGTAEAGHWDEPRHRDGAASVVHASLTLFGRRDVRAEQSVPERSPWPAVAAETTEAEEEDLEQEEEEEQEDEEGQAESASEDEGAQQASLEQPSGLPEVVFPCVPGTFYLGQASFGILWRRPPPFHNAVSELRSFSRGGVLSVEAPTPHIRRHLSSFLFSARAPAGSTLHSGVLWGGWRGTPRNPFSLRGVTTKYTTAEAKRASSSTASP